MCKKLVLELIKRKHPVMLWGKPGIGKTELVAQIAAELGLPLRVFIASVKQPVDLSGIPVPDIANGVAVWLRPSDLPLEKCLFFIDEINTSVASMQAALMQLVQERRVGDHHLHPETVIIAAGNRVIDRAAAQRMPTALRNRFAHFTVVTDIKSFSNYAATFGVDPYLVAFLNFRASLLHIMPGEKIDDGDMKVEMDAEANAFPTPRSWVRAAAYLNLPAELRQPLVASHVGDGPAAELEAFLRCQHATPTMDEVLANPATAKIPADGDAASRYAITGMLCRNATRDNFPAIMEYACRLGREYEVLTVIDSIKRHEGLDKTAAFGDWAVRNQDLVL
jgi:hypothetical protein